jgi:hypothetical protein
MPFEFGDQPDYYDTATLPSYWDLSNDMTVAAGEGLGGADAWEGDAAGAYVVKFPAGVDTTGFGFVVRLKIDSLPGADTILLGAVDAGDPPALQVCCVLNTDGTVSIYRGDEGGDLLATSAAVLPDDGSTFRLAFSGTISPTSGSAKVWFAADNDPLAIIVQAGGVSTDATGSGVRRGVYLGGDADIFASYLYTQGGGTLPQSPLCDVLLPDDDASPMDWTAEPSGTMASVTDEQPANEDTDYGYAGVVDDQYALEHETAPARSQYLGTRHVALVQNVEATPTYTFTPLIAVGGVVTTGPTRSVSDSVWTGVDWSTSVSPFSGLPWTTAAINAAAFGGQTTV